MMNVEARTGPTKHHPTKGVLSGRDVLAPRCRDARNATNTHMDSGSGLSIWSIRVFTHKRIDPGLSVFVGLRVSSPTNEHIK